MLKTVFIYRQHKETTVQLQSYVHNCINDEQYLLEASASVPLRTLNQSVLSSPSS